MSAILMELNSVQDYDLWHVICEYINLGKIFKALTAHFVTGVYIMKQWFTCFFTAQNNKIKEKTFLRKLVASNILH